MTENFKATRSAYRAVHSFAAIVAVISTLAALFSFFPSVEEISTAVIHALRSDARPVTSYRSIPVKTADEGELPDQVILLHNRKAKTDPISVTDMTPLKEEQQARPPESMDSSTSGWPMKDWGKIKSLEAEQLGFDHFRLESENGQEDPWTASGSRAEYKKVRPVFSYRAGQGDAADDQSSPGGSAAAATINESSSTRLLVTPIWKIERFRIVTILNTLVFLATVGLCCLVAFEASQFLKRGSGAEPDEPEDEGQASEDLEQEAAPVRPPEDEPHLLKVLTPDALRPHQAS